MSDDAVKRALEAQQLLDWPKHIAGAAQGNPYATLCSNCYGRHPPPHGEICPHPAVRATAVTQAAQEGSGDD